MQIPEELDISKRPILYKIFMDLPCAAAMNRIILDDTGNPIDYIATEVNTMFTVLLGTTVENSIRIRASEHLPPAEFLYWLGIFGPVALEGVSRSFNMFSQKLNKNFNGTVVCPRRGYFFVMFVLSGQAMPVIPLI